MFSLEKFCFYIKQLIENPYKLFIPLWQYGFTDKLSDDLFLSLLFRAKFNKKLKLNNPTTFNEKLQWLKLNDRKSYYSILVDKYNVKKYISDKIGSKYIIPTYGVYDGFDEIDFNKLPNEFVLKCTHDSGTIIIVNDKQILDIDYARNKINKCLSRNFFLSAREWPYKNVKPQIIAEKLLVDRENDLKDYKFFCFNGTVKCFKIDFNRFKDHRANYYDRDGNVLNIGETSCPPNYEVKIPLPIELPEMIRIAEIISNKIPFLRVDLYLVNGNIYFGECTFYPAAGFGEFTNNIGEQMLGDWLNLENIELSNLN